jgi:PleD family two-component response regulator
VIMFDVDRFKEINDDDGHVAGDRVLLAIAGLVRDELRGLDRLTRYSGEDSYHCTKSASFDTLARVTCSFGVCEYNGDEDADALVRRVDDLMYRARRSGRNGLVAG